MIEFLCPEGHKIRCPEEKAGRPAKCPKCGVGFRIPTLEELGLSGSHAGDSSAANEQVTDAPPPLPDGNGNQPASRSAISKEPQIEFLCPNGHHLHGPSSLQGRAGECPECGSRFRIPVVDDTGADTPAEPELPLGQSAAAEEEIRLDSSTSASQPADGQSTETLDFLQVLESGIGSPADRSRSAAPLGRHPLASLFIELWAARGEGSRVEVHLESGSVLVPDGYLNPHSQHDYAVLVTKDPDGCSTITIVPWSAIARIIMRAIKEVPGEVVR